MGNHLVYGAVGDVVTEVYVKYFIQIIAWLKFYAEPTVSMGAGSCTNRKDSRR